MASPGYSGGTIVTYIMHFFFWLTGLFIKGATTGMAHDDEEIEEWPGEIYLSLIHI